MTMVLPSPYNVVDTHHLDHHYPNAVVYGAELLDSLRRRSTSSPASFLHHCNYFNSSDQMADELIRPDNDPNQLSSSSIDPTADENWLNLRLGGDGHQTSSSTLVAQRSGGERLVELDLLPTSTTNTSQRQQQVIRSNTRPTGFFHTPAFRAPPRIPVQELNWAVMRPSNFHNNNYYMTNPASTTSLIVPMGPNFFERPNFGGATQTVHNGGGGGEGMRIIRPPRRPNVGVWFMLQVSQNQVGEPFLPQIPKSYLRIKNGQITIRLLMKYLVQKLGLDSESEVEIRCRGQALEPILTLLHVRDSIWCTRGDTHLNMHTSDSPASSSISAAPTDDSHIMILHYARPIILSATAATTTGTTS